MSYLFLFLFLLSIVGLIIGVVKPSLVKVSSRKKASVIFGSAIVVFFILMAVTTPLRAPVVAKGEEKINTPIVARDNDKLSVAPQKAESPSVFAEQPSAVSAQEKLTDFMALSTDAHIVKSYDFAKDRIIYVDYAWYQMTVAQKQDFVAHIAILKKAATGYQHFQIHDAYSNEKVAEVTALLGSVEIYK